MIWKCFLGLFIAILGYSETPHQWMNEQIEEDLKDCSPFTTNELYLFFQKLDLQGFQALYFKVRNSHVTWYLTQRQDSNRKTQIFDYIKSLAQRYALPDLDVILLTDDGCDSQMKLPILTFSAFKNCNALLFPDSQMIREVQNFEQIWIKPCLLWSQQNPWSSKQCKAYFRGAGTGRFNLNHPIGFDNDRMNLMILSSQYPEWIDSAFSIIYYPIMQESYYKLGKKLDFSSIPSHFQYKYLLDVDGNASTYERCRWILLSNSVLVKINSPYRQWYYKALQPCVHYVPVQQDYSNLISTLQYLKEHDSIAQEIALEGQKLGCELFKQETIDLYVTKLLQKYSKLVIISD